MSSKKSNPRRRRVANAELNRVGLIRREALHQCLALFRDILQLRRKDERVPSGLDRFVGHVFALVVVRSVPGVLASSARLPPCDQAGSKNDKNWFRLPLCGATRIVRCEIPPCAIVVRSPECGKRASGAFIPAMLQERASARFVERRVSYERCCEFLIDLNELEGVIGWPTSLAGVNVGAAIHA